MKKLHKLALCLLALLSFYAPQAFAETLPEGIPPFHEQAYKHAKQALEQHFPAFLTNFQTLQEEMKTIDSSDKEAQFEAFMRFLPTIEELNNITYLDAWNEWGGYRPLQCEVIFSFFSIYLPTADEGRHTSIMDILINTLVRPNPHSEASRKVSVEEIMEEHNISREDAQRILTAWTKLHRNWPW